MLKEYDYDRLAEYYDVMELNAEIVYHKSNPFIHSILKRYGAKNVLDFTAGTGVQAIYLSRYYKVTANDLSHSMLSIAKAKAKRQKARVSFSQGDMRLKKLGKFDAVITIFNAIGHLDEGGFGEALKNIAANLNDNGIYIFDIFNLSRFKRYASLGYKFIDVASEHGDMKFLRFNNNSLDKKRGIFKINQETWIQKGYGRPRVVNERWDMKIYTLQALKKLLKSNNFKVLEVYGGWGNKFSDTKSSSIVVVAQKQ